MECIQLQLSLPLFMQVIELPLKHPELFDALGIAQPKVRFACRWPHWNVLGWNLGVLATSSSLAVLPFRGAVAPHIRMLVAPDARLLCS